ncbi:heat shock factor binding protein 1-domain-containing protein [Lentinula raphanica]|uniref:Heat shock factor binding protein 1-domain-containing protein n=1 Tax=Lentinula raphanica TaxID=153919 RepID=A0AA38UEP9_9AGAR|nr:heat shock factor binding protein 1-domain-containing protein [Lentinula raphanica]KAJ3826734.1 heat shock factor binding protein 1-domain-containing protein [Lentinula raphanica]KAJ3838350.1 heat shock factor binding protein 1-domain-containing protein [Lentinula raphanica]KAJ3974983.1 heat shock factor binding protein 1-domain-containing protein [Lentinula raphanica]
MASTSTAQAQPLKVSPATPAKNATENDPSDKTPLAVKGTTTPKPSMGVNNISSPHELTAFVETLLEQLDSKFDEMSSQILDRMNQMSTRVDALESSIQDIINGDLSVPQSPSPIPGTPGGMR